MISEQNKVRARAHLGYLGVQSSATFVLGVPAAVQTQFTIEAAFTKILASTEPLFIKYLDRLDLLEEQIVENTPNLAASKIDEIELRDDEFNRLLDRYRHWQGALANLMGITPNPFDQRPFLGVGWNGGGSGINVPISH